MDTTYGNIKREYPLCDNCNRLVVMFGKHVVRNGIVIYVHETYNAQTGKCDS